MKPKSVKRDVRRSTNKPKAVAHPKIKQIANKDASKKSQKYSKQFKKVFGVASHQ